MAFCNEDKIYCIYVKVGKIKLTFNQSNSKNLQYNNKMYATVNVEQFILTHSDKHKVVLNKMKKKKNETTLRRCECNKKLTFLKHSKSITMIIYS